MNTALLVQRLMRAGLPMTTIDRKCGFGAGRVSRLIKGNGSLSAEERERLESFAAEVLPRGALASPHHERVSPRYGR